MTLLELAPRLHPIGWRWLALAATRPVVVLLGVNPLADGGGGKRPAMLARELVRRGHAVLHLYAFPRGETVDLRVPTPTGVLELDVHRARTSGLLEALCRRRTPWVLVEVPVVAHLRLARSLAARGARVIYDCIDAWQGSLGAGWYDAALEDRLAREAHALVGSAGPLLERLAARTGRLGVLVPNAVDTERFDAARAHPRPSALPAGPVVLYAGALWGDWLDWPLVHRLGAELPEARVIMLGDHRGEGQGAPPNVRFPGLVPHTAIPAYLAHADVAILPWRVDVTTLGTSPLKVYEYLAMGCPVIAPDLPALRELAGVERVDGPEAFVEAVRRALARPRRPPGDDFRRRHAWAARVDTLLALLDDAR